MRSDKEKWRQSSQPMNINVFLTVSLWGVLSSTCIDCASAYNIATSQERTPKYFIKLVCLSHGCANHDAEGKCFKSPIHCCDVTKPPYLFSIELCTSPLHCNSCLCTPCAVGAPGSASLCSEHVNQTSYGRSGRQKWEKLRHRAVTQCVTLAHPWSKRNVATTP